MGATTPITTKNITPYVVFPHTVHLACTNHTKRYQRKSEQELLSNTNLAPWFSTPLGRNLGGFQNLPHHRPKCRPIKSADRVPASVFLDQSPHFTGEDSRKVRWFFPRIFSRWYCGICPLFQISEHLRDWFYQPMARSLPANMCEQLVFRTLTQPSSVQTGFVLSWTVCVTGRDGQGKGQHSRDNRGLLTAAGMLRAFSSRPSPAPSRPAQAALPARKYFFPLAVSYFGALPATRALAQVRGPPSPKQ